MKRREFLTYSALGAGSATLISGLPIATLLTEAQAGSEKETEFSEQWLQSFALNLAQKRYQAPRPIRSRRLKQLGYEQYRDIRFRPEKSIWREQDLPFQMQLFHTGFLYKHDVAIHTVEDGKAKRLQYDANLFSFGKLVDAPGAKEQGGFSGFRIHSQINKKNIFDEFCLFQGASYFRAVGKSQAYGLSARGLAINTGQPKGEEFPSFRTFWIEKPSAQSKSITVYALLDSVSVVGVYKYVIAPGNNTVMKVSSTLYPRKEMNHVGIGPLTSMFMHGPANRVRFDDFRPRIHDSQGLCVMNGSGERIWRPLINPKSLQYTSFMDENPEGFGLVQRSRAFEEYQDLEASYEKRPSLWVRPDGEWGRGSVQLIEIPTTQEIHDNVVAYWKPTDTLKPGQVYTYNYTLHWGSELAHDQEWKAHVVQSRVGLTLNKDKRQFVIDFAHPSGKAFPLLNEMTIDLTNSSGKVENIVTQPNPHTNGVRLSFQFDPQDIKQADLRGVLIDKHEPVTEVWVYRWEG